MTTTPVGLVEVRLLQLPVQLWAASQEHTDELLREFTLMTADPSEPGDGSRAVPHRLVELVHTLTERFAGMAAAPRAELFAAAAEGRASIDLTYHFPAEAADAVAALDRLLDEADDYCRAGQHLLTLATPEPIVRYRKWHLLSFVEQLGGAAPVPWPEFRAART